MNEATVKSKIFLLVQRKNSRRTGLLFTKYTASIVYVIFFLTKIQTLKMVQCCQKERYFEKFKNNNTHASCQSGQQRWPRTNAPPECVGRSAASFAWLDSPQSDSIARRLEGKEKKVGETIFINAITHSAINHPETASRQDKAGTKGKWQCGQ